MGQLLKIVENKHIRQLDIAAAKAVTEKGDIVHLLCMINSKDRTLKAWAEGGESFYDFNTILLDGIAFKTTEEIIKDFVKAWDDPKRVYYAKITPRGERDVEVIGKALLED